MKKFLIFVLFLLLPPSIFAEEFSLYEQELIQKVKGVFDLEKKPPFDLPVCATPIFLEIHTQKDKLSPQAKKVLEPYTSRPGAGWDPHLTLDTPLGYFRIHYTVTGSDAVFEKDVDNDGNDVPDYVDSCAKILDYTWYFEIDSLGYNPPPSDSFYPSDNGGDGKYDVYLTNMSKQWYGYTEAESLCAGSDRCMTSFMALRNDYSYYSDTLNLYEDVYEPLSVTAAHEFFHSIHFSYDAYEGDPQGQFWLEISSVWMEEQVFDKVNDYLYYLFWFFKFPWLSLKTFSTDPRNLPELYHPYASCVWAIFLREKFNDQDIIKKIWEKCGEIKGENSIEATDQVLGDTLYKSSFEDAFREFMVWNYFVGERALPGEFYSEGETFFDTAGRPMEIRIQDSFSSYPVDTNSNNYFNAPENLGANYVVFYPLADTGGLKLNFSGAQNIEWKSSLVGYNKDYAPLQVEFNLNSSQEGSAQIDNWTDYEEIIMIPTVVSLSDRIRTYHYQFKGFYDPSLHGEVDYKPWVRIIPYQDEYLAFVGEDFNLSVKATDQNSGDTLTIRKFGVGDFGVNDVVQGVSPLAATFKWRPTQDLSSASLYQVKFIVTDPTGLSDTALVEISLESKPKKDVVFQNCPNPFILSEHQNTYFQFELSEQSTLKITIFTLAGEVVRSLPESQEFSFGYHGCESRLSLPSWDGTNEKGEKVSSGVYLYHVKTKNSTVVKKMAVLR